MKRLTKKSGKTAALSMMIILSGLGCFGGSYTAKPPDYREIALNYNRYNFGNAPFPFWMHVTGFEINALLDAEKAKAGDPDALFALALVASGNVRDSAVFMRYKTRVSKFIARVAPAINSRKDTWQKGFQLFQAMRGEFFTKDRDKELAGYDWFKSGMSAVFEDGSYNCISSSMLYIILARYFSMNVKGVVLPTHAFALLNRDAGKSIEIETTAKLGFDWIHDEQYFKTKSAGWLQARGLPAVTYADYRKRAIMEPYQLICFNMTNQHTDVRRMRIEDIHRLKEIQAFIESSNPGYQRERLIVYNADFAYLQGADDYETAERLFTCVDPVIESAQRSFGKDTSILSVVARLRCNRVGVLCKLRKFDEFIASVKTALAAIAPIKADSSPFLGNCLSNVNNFMSYCAEAKQFDKVEKIADIVAPFAAAAKGLDQNLQWALGVEVSYCWERNNWPEIIRICGKQMRIAADPKNRKTAQGNLEAAYCNWSNAFAREGNWPKARDVLRQCENDSLAGHGKCAQSLKELEAAHRF